MNFRSKIYLIVAFLAFSSLVSAQTHQPVFNLNIGYGFQLPQVDLKERFGFLNTVGVEAHYYRNNFYIAGGWHYLFGYKVKEDNILDKIESSVTNEVIGYNGSIGENPRILLNESGYLVPLRVGKVFPKLQFFAKNNYSGVYTEIGTQFIQHKISIQVKDDNVPQLTKEYLKGYDRLTNGFGLIQGVGYKYYSKNKTMNFYFGVELSENFTQNRRDWNFDQGLKDDKKRMDVLLGFKIGYMLIIKKRASGKDYLW